MQTGNGRSNRFGFIKVVLMATQLIAFTTGAYTEAFASASHSGTIQVPPFSIPPTSATDVLDGITLAGPYTDADVAYLRENLELLRDQLPVWNKYIADAKPLVFVIDPAEGAHGRAAVAQCCIGGHGVITFGDHFGTIVDSDDPASQTPEARRLTFLVTLVHEVTHIRDQRAGRFLQKTNFKSCVEAEKSAFDKQIKFEQDLLATKLGENQASEEIHQTRLEHQIRFDTAALKMREMWDQYCGAFSQ